MDYLKTMIQAVPSIKGPVQLAGFLFAGAGGVAVKVLTPADAVTFGVFAVLGVFLVATALAMSDAVLRLIKPGQRAYFLFAMLALFSLTVLLMVGYSVVEVSRTLSPNSAKFDVDFQKDGVHVMRGGGPHSYVVTLEFRSLEAPSPMATGAQVFMGEIFVHDAAKIPAGGGERLATLSSCFAGSVSCLGSATFAELFTNPMLIPAGATGITMTRTVHAAPSAGNVHLWVRFFQREGGRQGVCEPRAGAQAWDGRGPNPPIGLYLYGRTGERKEQALYCHGAQNDYFFSGGV